MDKIGISGYTCLERIQLYSGRDTVGIIETSAPSWKIREIIESKDIEDKDELIRILKNKGFIAF